MFLLQYLRLPDDVPVTDVITWMEQIWELKHPKLILSFYGGHEGFSLLPELHNSLQFGLMKVKYY